MSYMNDEWWDEDDDFDEYEYDQPPLTLLERIDQWFSHTRIGRLYWRLRHAIRHRYNDYTDIPF